MSFDFAVWEGTAPASHAEGLETFTVLMDKYFEAEVHGEPLTPAILAFVAALKEAYPGDTEEEFDAAPWAGWPLDPDAVGPIIYSGLRWSAAESAVPRIVSIAARMGLVYFDPQGEQVLTPLARPLPHGSRGGTKRGWRR